MHASDTSQEFRSLMSSAKKRTLTRKVSRAFEVWDPSFGMMVIMTTGAVLDIIGIVFDKDIGAGMPPIKRAVEIDCEGTRYYGAYDRLLENTLALGRPDAS
jgi:hypothetical protein